MAQEPPCAVCKGPGRYVRGPGAWCAEHAPLATPPWIMIAQAGLALAILLAGAYKLVAWLKL